MIHKHIYNVMNCYGKKQFNEYKREQLKDKAFGNLIGTITVKKGKECKMSYLEWLKMELYFIKDDHDEYGDLQEQLEALIEKESKRTSKKTEPQLAQDGSDEN